MDDKVNRKMLENCLEFDGDKGQVMEGMLCVIGFGEEETQDE